MTNEEKIALIREGKYSADEFIRENEKLVYAVLHKYKNGKILVGTDEEDLYSMGLGGLYKALCDFDPDYGVAFTSFAWRYILTEIQRYYRTIQPHNYHQQTALFLSDMEYDVVEGKTFNQENYRYNLEGLKLTERQKEWYLAYIETTNFTTIAERYGVSKQAVRESVQKVQRKMREKYL